MSDSSSTRTSISVGFGVVLILASLLMLAFLDPRGPPNAMEITVVGLILGTMFGQATLAAAWTPLGPGIFPVRVVLSLSWFFFIAFALTVNVGPGSSETWTINGLLFVQWLLAQIPLWGLSFWYGVGLRRAQDVVEATGPPLRQFGIRQLMVLTAIVAVFLGIGRLIIPYVARSYLDEIAVFGFLTAAGMAMTLSLLLATLLPRYSVLATLVVAMLIALFTEWEWELVTQLAGTRGGPQLGHLIAINIVQGCWIVLIATLLRVNGFALRGASTTGPRSAPFTSGEPGSF